MALRKVCQPAVGCASPGEATRDAVPKFAEVRRRCIRCRGPCGPSRSGLRERNVRLVIRYQGSATIRQGKTVIEGDCVVESAGDQLAEPDLPWSGRFHDPGPRA